MDLRLSFLGMGVKPPCSSWGILIDEGANRTISNPWLLFSLLLLRDEALPAQFPRQRTAGRTGSEVLEGPANHPGQDTGRSRIPDSEVWTLAFSR